MNRLARLLMTCLVVGAGVGIAFAQTRTEAGRYVVDAWQVEDGLPDNRVTSVVQTTDGYLWIGTYNGLVRFDGVKFAVFDSRTPGLGSGRIVSLFAERAGALWVGMESGDLARMEDGRFTAFGREQGWVKKMPQRFAQEPAGAVLVATMDGGIARFHNGRFATLLEGSSEVVRRTVSFSGPMNLAFDAATNGLLWARTAEGLKVFQDGTWSTRAPAGLGGASEISGLAPARGGGVWACAAGRVWRVRGGEVTPLPSQVPTRAEAGCTELMEDAGGKVWLATWGRGLFQLAPDGTSQTFTMSNGVSAFVRCVFEDAEGNIWGGTSGDGLLRLKPRLFTSYASEPPLPSYRCNALAAHPDGGLWIGTDGHGLVRWDGKFSEPLSLADLPFDRPVWGLATEASGRLWLGTYWNGALSKDATGDRRFQKKDGLGNERVYAVHVARDGAVWFGTDNGVSRYENGRFENFTPQDGLPAGAVRTVAQDAAGALWFGYAGGGAVRRHDGRFEVFRLQHGLPHNSVRALLADADGTVWMGTADGLARWRDGRIAGFRVADGLPNGKIASILDDGLGHLWLGTGLGVVRVARAQLDGFADGKISRLEGVRYLKGDGLASAQCSEGSPAAVRTSDGRLWFATSKGVSVVSPRELRTNTVVPPVVIEDVRVDGIPVAASRESAANSSDEGVRRSHGMPLQGIEVPPGRRRVEIHYAGLSFTAPERVKFRYRLEGFERDWRDVGGERSAVFHGLPPGKYRFHVLAANNDGVWNEAGASLAFVVRPELWQTAWFRAGLGLVVAGIVFALVRGRIVRLQRQQVAQREFSRGLITSQEAERKRIAAELHDSLGQNLLVIKNRAVMGRNPGASPAQELEEIARLATQSIEEVREISQNLRPYQLDRLGLTRALHGLVKKVGASGPLQCVADITPVDRVFATEAETNLFRIVQEALNNVLKHSGATEARVVVERDDTRVRLRIEDNGRGFEWPLKHADSAHGMGLGGILERVRILDGQLEIDTAPGRGTKLSIEVPVPEGAK